MGFSAKLKAMFGAQDMTVGKPMDCLIKFSVPLLIGNLAQQLYNTVDSIVVGQYIGDTALAAVGTAGPVLNLMLVLLMGISTGASILTSQFFGAKDRAQLSSVVGSAIFLTVSSGIVMMVIGYFASPWLISLVAPPDDVAIGATAYLQVIFLGMVGCGMYNILSGVLRGIFYQSLLYSSKSEISQSRALQRMSRVVILTAFALSLLSIERAEGVSPVLIQSSVGVTPFSCIKDSSLILTMLLLLIRCIRSLP